MPFKLTARAAKDLVQLTEYGIERFGENAARSYLDTLFRVFDLIAEMPLLGAADRINPGFRRFLHGRHVIVYRVDDAGIVIARLLHTAMDAPRHPLGDDGR